MEGTEGHEGQSLSREPARVQDRQSCPDADCKKGKTQVRALCTALLRWCAALHCTALPAAVTPTDHGCTRRHLSRLSINPVTNQPKQPNQTTQLLTLRKPTVGPKSTT